MSYGKRYSVSKPTIDENEDAPVVGGAVPRQKVTARCKSIDRYGDSDVDLTRKRSFSDEYFKRVARDLKSIPCLLLLGNIFAFVFLIIWSNIAKHLFAAVIPTTITAVMETSPPLIKSIRELHMCSRPRCGAAGHALAYGLDSTVYPCQDIVRHVCTGWLQSSEENYMKVTLGSTKLYMDDMHQDLKRYIELMDLNSAELSAKQKVAVFYRKCLEAKYVSHGRKRLMSSYGLEQWPYEDTFSPDFETIFRGVLRRTNLGALLSVGTSRLLSDPINGNEPDKNIYLSLDCPTFTIPRHALLVKGDVMRPAYENYVKATITNYTGISGSVHKTIAAFEINNAFVARRFCHRRRLKLKKVSSMGSLNHINWVEFLQTIVGESSNFKITGDTQILIRSVNYLRYVASQKNLAKRKRAVNYIGWRILHHYGRHALSDMMDEHDAFMRKSFNMTAAMPMWKKCLMTTNDVMPMALGRVYVDTMTRLKTFLAVHELVEKVKFSFKYMLSQATWLDKEERLDAYTRIGAMETMVGVPPWIVNDTVLNGYYANLSVSVSTSYLDLFLMASEHSAMMRFLALDIQSQLLNTPAYASPNFQIFAHVNVRPLHSFIFPARVVDLKLHQHNLRQALVYDVNENALLLPAGLLQPPYFDPNLPDAFNYGGLGVMILNDMVREYFRFYFNDNKNNKWRTRVKCINDQVYRKREDSSGSLEESHQLFTVVFTMMTIRSAYNAYHYFLGARDDNVVAGLGHEVSPDQLFFLASARTLCSMIRDEHRALIHINQGHLLLKKLTSALQGMDELQDAFKCLFERRNSYYYCMESKVNVEET